MYGKFFASTFTGSMFGAGPDVFAVWGYVIAHTVDSTVELNPPFLAAVLGTTPERISAAIAILASPDERSRSKEAEGRRIVHESAYQYRVVNHAHYRALRNEEERRAYNRAAQKRSRVKRKVNDMSAVSAHTEAEAISSKQETKAKTEAKIKGARPSAEVQKRAETAEPQTAIQRRPRGGLLGKHHLCPEGTWAACERGLCLPGFLYTEWLSQCGGDPATIAPFVDLELSMLPLGPVGDPVKFWRGKWDARFRTPEPSQTGSTASTIAAARQVMKERGMR